jgi:GT2 family glycosyltransferase
MTSRPGKRGESENINQPKQGGVPVCICVHEDSWHLEAVLRSFGDAGPATVFVSEVAWNGDAGDPSLCIEIARKMGAEILVGRWADESAHRSHALATMKERGHRHFLLPDSDEVCSPELLKALLAIAANDLSGCLRVAMSTYWRSPRFKIEPPENLAPILMLDAQESRHVSIRDYTGPKPLVLGPEHGVLHHLSYVGPDERIFRKISTWGHRHELVSDWYAKVWKGWDQNHFMRDLHPTHPGAYGCAERIELPKALIGVSDLITEVFDPEVTFKWPSVSVIIPLYGGSEQIKACLESLEKCRSGDQPLEFETIVVDDCSPDGATAVAETFPWVTLLKSERNEGFAATCNKGFAASSGSVAVFLNSDTRVPKAGFIRLIECLSSSGTVGAAGPFTNNAGYHQRFESSYRSPQTLDLFAQEFADRDAEDRDVSMLVGFCLAVRRSVLEEVGLFDPAFGRGLFEDTDLVYRIQRAGYKTRLAARSFVHHEGSQSLIRSGLPVEELLERNRLVYEAK